MKLKFLITIYAFALGLILSTYSHGSKTTMKQNTTIEKATYITLASKPERAVELKEFLQNGSKLVRQTEPGTPFWFGLQENNNFAIFDLFYDETGRANHFSGQVAAKLKEHASELLQGSWEDGVLKNIHNFDLISINDFNKEKVLNAKVTSLIIFKVKQGHNQELESFLRNAAPIIDSTEPQTYLWIALKMDNETYAIFDIFPGNKAQQAHFSGKVAEALKNNANELIQDGWEKGILANVHHFQIIASS